MRTIRTLSLILIAALIGVSHPAASGDSSPTAAAAPQRALPGAAAPAADFVPGEILVKRLDRASDLAVRRAAARVGARTLKRFPSIGVELWHLDSALPVGRAIAELHRTERGRSIEYVEPNWILSADALPNDARFGELWAMHNVGQTGGTDDADIDAAEAWDVETGSANVVIAVIDTGVDYLHEDLAANIWTNPGEIAGNGIDDDGNGYVDDVRGWDFVNDDNDPMDDAGHGTHTSGTIGAIGGNGVGVAGVAWAVSIMPLKFLNSGGFGSTDDAIEAVLYATSFSVPISSNSWGGSHRSKALESAIADSGSLFVAAAGNSGSSRKHYPAGYSLENVLSVAATDHDDLLADFSNYGTSWVDLAAPGVDILSSVPGNGYELYSGTSMATPHVSGVAALVLAQNPSWTPLDIKAQVLGTIDPLDSLTDLVATSGRLNAAAAVGVVPPPPPADETPPDPVTDLIVDAAATTHHSVGLTWTAPGDDGNLGTAFLYDLRYDTVPLDPGSFGSATQAVGEPVPQPAGATESFTVTGLTAETTYYFALVTYDEAGNASTLSNVATETTLEPPPTAWTITSVGSGGVYYGLDFDPSATPAVAYWSASTANFALWDEVSGTWVSEPVDGGNTEGVNIAYDDFGRPTVTYGWSKVFATEKVGGSWQRTTVANGTLSEVNPIRLAPDGTLAISYRSRKGLGFAQRAPSGSWSSEIVDPGAAARYSALAYDPNGYPAIAYCDDLDGDGWLSTLKLARFDGSSWSIEVIADGTQGYGVFAAIAFAPGSNQPTLMHHTTRLLEWDGSQWVEQILDPESSPGNIAYASDGTLFAVWAGGDEQMKMSFRAAGTTLWSAPEVIDPGPAGAFALPVAVSPDESRLYVVYEADDGVRAAWRNLP